LNRLGPEKFLNQFAPKKTFVVPDRQFGGEGRNTSVKLVKTLCFLMLISSLGVAQSGSGNADSLNPANIGEELKQLREAVAEQKQAMAEQQKQISRQQQEIEELRTQASPVANTQTSQDQTPRMVDAKLTNSKAPKMPVIQRDQEKQSGAEKVREAPLSFRIGGADFTPGGFMDMTAYWRSTNPGSGYGTNFFSIPYHNTVPGQLSETRFTAENSRISLKANSIFKGNNATGYFEMDFHGNDPANAFVTSNSHTNRIRLYWVDVRRDKWEVLGGQSWSWLTPNRVGLSPNPSDVFYSQDTDPNYQAGLTWTRSAQIRVAYHPNDNWAVGLAAESPDQFIGQTNQVVLPAGLAVATQFDAANQTSTPNVMPDLIPKIAYDHDIGGKHFHLEAVGLLTALRLLPALGGSRDTKFGAGGSVNVNLEVVKGFRLIASSFYSDGGGRYIFGSGPQAVIRPNGTVSLVHAFAGIGGFEYQANKKLLLAAYYGGDYFQRNFFADTTSTAAIKPLIGYGAPGAATANALAANRAIQEPTFDLIYTFWKDPKYGALQVNNQISYLTRSPWFVPTGQPKNARSTMVWSNLRWVLP
jgi:hypothetical protein